MKAIGTAAITHAGVIAPGAILASGLFTGAFWLLMGVAVGVTWIARLTSRSIAHGLVLGLGLSLMLDGVKLMDGDWVLAVAAMALTFPLPCQLSTYRSILTSSCCWSRICRVPHGTWAPDVSGAFSTLPGRPSCLR